MLEGAPIATIKRMSDDWKKIGDERLAGGRKSVDEADAPPKPETQRTSYVPESAYRG